MRQVIETHLPNLSQAQLAGLAPWVCGAILSGSACQNAVASALSPRGAWNNLRQYLREWLYGGGGRARPCKTELDASLCFAPLLRWVLTWWRSGRLALAVDPALMGDDTTAIVISVVYAVAPFPWPGASGAPPSAGPGWTRWGGRPALGFGADRRSAEVKRRYAEVLRIVNLHLPLEVSPIETWIIEDAAEPAQLEGS